MPGYSHLTGQCPTKNETLTALRSEIMLQINERLYLRGLISREVCEQAKVRIVKNGASNLP